MSKEYLKPKTTGVRSPTTNQQQNGNIINPPTFPTTGGMTAGAWKRGHVTVQTAPKAGKKVI